MKFLFLVFFLFINTTWAVSPAGLSPLEKAMYEDVHSKCHDGSYWGAAKIGLDPKIVMSAGVNLSKIMMLSVSASDERWKSRMMSPELYRIRNNNGFWWALVDCYSQQPLGRKLLVKSIIDLGHLSSEVAGSIGSLYYIGKVGELTAALHQAFPTVARVLVTIGIDFTLYRQYSMIREEFFAKPTPQQEAHINAIEQAMFKDVNQTISLVHQLVQNEIVTLETQLSNPDLTSEQRMVIEAKRDGLKAKRAELGKIPAQKK